MNYSETLNLAAKVRELKDSISQANILDAVYVNENVHSRILRLIMDYKIDGHYPFYEEFLRLKKVSTIIPDDISCSEPHFFNERDRIDLLIEGNDYAIIIENKIYNAIDQDHQMERYLLSCIGRGFKKERIFALYLTSDGTKNISKNSLTDKALEVLGFSDQTTGRFAEISFRYDILPWLRNNICRTNDDEQIKSALIQYADYLAGMFREREKESKKDLAITQLLAKYEVNSVSAFCNCISVIYNLSEELNQRRDIYCQSLAMTHVSKPLRKYCTDHGIELTYEFYSFSFLSIRMSLPGISKASFRFNTEGDGRN
ncbi:MAG: PD-(D/E)XK nuclease family protein, partial [Bacteroidales bacterium]|nr:PD-(D/E)XK nuclease family protein [Bacteroidales bacterium]